MKMPIGLTAPEIRILQEFRRLETKEMALDAVRQIKHPTKAPDEALDRLLDAGFLNVSEDKSTYRLTETAESLLARPCEPEVDRWGKDT